MDFDICNEYSIKYAEEKDEYTAIRFVYDNVIREFDPYFTKEKSANKVFAKQAGQSNISYVQASATAQALLSIFGFCT